MQMSDFIDSALHHSSSGSGCSVFASIDVTPNKTYTVGIVKRFLFTIQPGGRGFYEKRYCYAEYQKNNGTH